MKRSGIAYRWELVGWLWAAFFLNQADRQIYSVVLPQIQADLGLSDVQAGLVASLFTVAIGVMVPFSGFAADAFSKRWVVAISLGAWSVATLLTGFSSGLVHLILVRSVATAVGEAFYAPAANALIGEHHGSTRAAALSIHQTSVYAGIVASGLLAGHIADLYGWRTSFWVFGTGGVILAAPLAWRLKDGPRNAPAGEALTPGVAVRAVFGSPSVLLLGAAFAGMNFVNAGYLAWMPTYIHERFHLTLAGAGFSSMFYHHFFAFLGVLAGGQISDRVARRLPKARMGVQAAGFLMGAPFLWYLGRADSLGSVLVALSAFGFCRGLYDSNIYAALYDVISPRFRGSASAVVIAFGFTFGSCAPLLLGMMKRSLGLSSGFSALSVFYLAAAGAILVAMFRYADRDRARAQLDEVKTCR